MRSNGKLLSIILSIATFIVLWYDKYYSTQGNPAATVIQERSSQIQNIESSMLIQDDTELIVAPPNMLFEIYPPFQLPVPHSTLPLNILLKQSWVSNLQEILLNIDPNSGPISLTTSDFKFREVLLNWLAASTLHIAPQLSNPLILCMDQSVYDLLQAHDILSIYAPPESFIDEKTKADLTKHVAFTETQILRLTVMRFLNHWGYDAANYDADAILVKNPEPLFYESHKESNLIGSYGKFPSEVRALWGVTICAGMFMIKSGPATELFWEKMNSVLPNSYNDQARLNNALMKLEVKWGKSYNQNITTTDWNGTTDIGFNVTILSGHKVCRHLCSKSHIDQYYVWHKGGSGADGKRKFALKGGLWYLKRDWETSIDNGDLKGTEWLRSITT